MGACPSAGDANRQISEYKFKLSKAEQEMGTMEQNVRKTRGTDGFTANWSSHVVCVCVRVCLRLQVSRLEGQVSRYKAAADNSEKIEDELKAEKRKLQREVGPGRVSPWSLIFRDPTQGWKRME